MNILGLNLSLSALPTPADLVAERNASLVAEQRGDPFAFQSGEGTLYDVGYHAFGAKPAAGVTVTEENSLAIAAVFAAVRVLAESVASLPLKLYRRDGRSRLVAAEHPLYGLLHDQGNDLMSAMKLREVMMVHLCLWGNFFGEKVRDGRGNVVGIWPIHPARVTVSVNQAGGRARLSFKVDKVNDPLDQDDVFHVAGLGTGLLGKSPIQLHREGLGIALSAERYGGRFFANDARPGLVLTHPGTLGDVAYARIKADWNATHQGAGNAHKLAILEEGMTPQTVGLPPEDAQFIETRKYQRGEVASIYRVPPHMIGDLDRATFSNIEHQGLEFVMHSLRPWLVRIEQAVGMQLLSEAERKTYYASHVVSALLRGDTQTRYQAYTQGRNWGWLSANDIRELEDLNPIADGDVYLQPLNMIAAGSDPFGEATPPSDASRSSRAALPPAERRALPSRYETARALEPVFLDAIRSAVRRETNAIRDAAVAYLDVDDVASFTDWMVAFADEHEAWTARRTAPAFQAMAEAMVEAAREELGADVSPTDLDTFVRDYVAAFARRYAGSARGQMLAIVESADDPAAAVRERLDEWEESEEGSPSRAEKEARNERQRSSNAFTAAAWTLVGVATLTWRSVGKSCEICNEMDGRSATVGKSFLDAGDTVVDLEVEGRISHPPLHQGCDCIMMPGTGLRSRLPEAEIRAVLATLAGGPSAEPAPRTWAQRRNRQIRERYRSEIATRYGERDLIIEELRTGEFEGQPYTLAFDTARKVCDQGRA